MTIYFLYRIYYWLDVHYDTSLLIQAVLMVIMQVLLLHVALQNKPTPSASYSTALQTPLAGSTVSEPMRRPFNFWRWRVARPYWSFLVYFTAALAFLHTIFRDVPSYAELLGYVALGIEATLPLPQVYENHQRKAFKGFRLSLLANWLIGDMMKMVFFFGSGGSVPWSFKMCGMFQFACDMFLGIQYWMFGSGADARLANGYELPKGS